MSQLFKLLSYPPLVVSNDTPERKKAQQESIPLGCEPPAYQPYVLFNEPRMGLGGLYGEV